VRCNEWFSHCDVLGRADCELVSQYGVRAPVVCAQAIKCHVLLQCKLSREQCKTTTRYMRASRPWVRRRKNSCVLSPSRRCSCVPECVSVP
jgi:hypothetical protein